MSRERGHGRVRFVQPFDRMRPLRAALIATVLATVSLGAPPDLLAQSYVEQKDNDNVGIIERALAKIGRDPALFDGKAIPAGADLAKVGELATRLNVQLGVVRKHHDELSAAGKARPAVKALMATWNDLAAYSNALTPVYNAAAARANDAAARRAVADAAAKDAGIKACVAFRKEVNTDPTDRERLDRVMLIFEGVDTHWQTVEDGAKHRATMAKVAALCTRPEFSDIGASCAYMSHGIDTHEARWCAASARADEVMKKNARGLAAWMAESLGPGRTAEQLADKDGWVDIEGPVTWADYFSGKKLRDQITARLKPIFEQAGLTDLEGLEVFTKLASHYATLEARVKELAPGWDLPGTSCAGVACAAAKKTAAAWYRGAAIKAVRQNKGGWTVVQNGLGIPTHRFKSGFVLLQVKGDPLCQLRSWTVTEDHKGGGRYQGATGAQIGYVRWQRCK